VGAVIQELDPAAVCEERRKPGSAGALERHVLLAHNRRHPHHRHADGNVGEAFMAKGCTVSVDLKVSLYGQGVVTVLAAIVVAVAFYLQLDIWFFLAVLVAMILLWASLMHRINRFRWRRLVLSHGGEQVVLISRDKYREAGQIGRRLIVSAFVICIRVLGERRPYWLCLFADSTDSASWKRLREMLRKR
jgi:hypothetical protein